ncbi:GerAB/ArcD/ProY family transporter [Paenibacillus hemerocallicola]|uniref:GerAB/ArcD/ProY family transporter n=1 Tax=Paenibacillus hemerocallicola TaxID=1172614 RepID=UPI00159EC7ED|nr:endospore germination permease [Paenibacillus hemerocallicola]
MEQGKIAPRQFTILVIMFIIGSSILLVPAALGAQAKQDAWISAILGVAVGLGIIVLLAAAGSRLPSASLTESLKGLLGKWLGTVVAIFFVIHAFLLSVFMLRYIGDFMATQIMPETPVEAIHIVFIILVIMAAKHGLETFTRSAEIFLPWVLIFLFILTLFVLPQMKLDNLLPIMHNGFAPVLKGSLPLIGIPYLELVLLLMVYPHVDDPSKRTRAFLLGGTIGGILIILITVLTLSVLGPYLTVRNIYPSFALTKKINIGSFLQRIEALLAITWFLTIYFKTTVTFYVTAVGIAQIFKLKRYQSVLAPLGFLAAIYALIVYPDIVYGIRFAGTIWTPYAAVFGLLLPLVLLGIAMLRKIGGSGRRKKGAGSR